MSEESPKLKPCPFCGHGVYVVPKIAGNAFVCSSSKCFVEVMFPYDIAAKRAVAKWNKRVSDGP